MMRSMTIWDVSEDAKEKGFPEHVAPSSSSPARSSRITPPQPPPSPPMPAATGEALGSAGGGGARALETSRADTLQERERNSMGSSGVSGGRKKMGSSRHCSATVFSMVVGGELEVELRWLLCVWFCVYLADQGESSCF